MGYDMMISVIVPVYKVERYLDQCVESIVGQTYRDLEIILVDDGSPDGCPALCDTWAARDSRIRVIHKANGGAASARNVGLDHAGGDYIAFVDSDDALEPDMYELLLSLLEEHRADIAHCGYRRYDLDGTEKEVRGTGEVVVQSRTEAERCLLEGRLFTGGLWNKLFPRRLLEGLRLPEDLVINEDVLFCFEAFARADKLVYQDSGKYRYYQREDSSCSRTRAGHKAADVEEAARRMLEASRGTDYEASAAARYAGAVSGRMRWAVMNGDRDCLRDCRRFFREQPGQLDRLSPRQRLNWRLMDAVPGLYRAVYGIYDKIRKPNWDV